MKHHILYSTVFAGVLGAATLGLFYNGAQALDIGEFTGADRKVITETAPKAGGIVLVKEDVVQPQRVRTLTATNAQVQQRTQYPAQYNAVAPAAGQNVYRDTVGGSRGEDLDGSVDITTMPGNAYDQVRARFANPGRAASAPIDGKPLVTTTMANGARVETMDELNAVAPAAGTAGVTPVSIRSEQSIRAQTGGSFNN